MQEGQVSLMMTMIVGEVKREKKKLSVGRIEPASLALLDRRLFDSAIPALFFVFHVVFIPLKVNV